MEIVDYEVVETRSPTSFSLWVVHCSKSRAKVKKESEEISLRLVNEVDSLTYKQYLELNDRACYLTEELERLLIEMNTWDKAREICLNLADEMN